MSASVIPFEIMATVTILWTMICAFIIAPLMVWNKIQKHGATPENIKNDVVKDLKMEMKIIELKNNTKFQEFQDNFSIDDKIFEGKFSEIIKTELNDQREIINENLDTLQKAIPGYLLQTLQTKEAGDLLMEIMKSGSQSLIGAWARSKGIDLERLEKGREVTKEWIMNNIENVEKDAPKQLHALSQIIKKLFPEDGDWIDEKIGAVQTIQQYWPMLMGNGSSKDRVSTALSPISGGLPSNPPLLSSQGARM